MEKIKLERFRVGNHTLYRVVGRHPFYGDLAGYFEGGQFIAHQTGLSGSFFARGVWANDGFALGEPVEIV